MKKIFVLSVLTTITSVAFADTGTSGINDAADGVVTYMPYVRALCYAIAAIIAVVGAVAVYYTMQTNPQNTAKRISMTVGSALTFVCLSLAYLSSLVLTEVSLEEAHQQVQDPAQAEHLVQAMDSLLLTKEVSHRVVSSLRFLHLQIGTGYISQMVPKWKQLAMLLTSIVSWAVVRKVHTDELLIISISSIGVRKSTLTPITL